MPYYRLANCSNEVATYREKGYEVRREVFMSKVSFKHISEAPADPIFGLIADFNQDMRPGKILLCVGIYLDEHLDAPVMKVVKKAEKNLVERESTKTYLPIEGGKNFLGKIGSLIFGDFFWVKNRECIVALQTPGGTGALRLGGEFLKQEVGNKISVPDPTWANHRGIFAACGMQLDIYPYYSLQTQKLEFKRFMQHMENLTTGTVVLLHACCHNPTGSDLTMDQWKIVSDLFLSKGLIPFFDFAYQGFREGFDEDAGTVRLFAEAGHHMFVAYSLSKNFGLYAERTGGLFVLTESAEVSSKVLSKLKVIIRTNYSNPPLHGAAIASEILSNPQLKKEWQEEVGSMRARMIKMRQLFCEALIKKSPKRDFRFLLEKSGMFCYTGLDKKEVERLREEFAIYMTQDGRMNLTGLNEENIEKVVDAIVKVSKI